MSCLQGDPNFDATLGSISIAADQKHRVFLTICIILRLLIAGVAYQYYDKRIFLWIALVASALGFLIIYPNVSNNQWWSRKFHLVVVIAIFISAVYQIYMEQVNKSIPILLYTDVFVGIITFIYLYFSCKNE